MIATIYFSSEYPYIPEQVQSEISLIPGINVRGESPHRVFFCEYSGSAHRSLACIAEREGILLKMVRGYEQRSELWLRTSIHRNYDDADLRQYEYLRIRGMAFWSNYNLRHDETLEVGLKVGQQREPDSDFLTAGGGPQLGVVFPNRHHDLIASSDMKRMVIRATRLLSQKSRTADKPVPWRFAKNGPWWELTSDLILPRVSPRCDVRDWHGRPIPPDAPVTANDCVKLVEGDFVVPEARYLRRDLQAIGEFDVALTFESTTPTFVKHRDRNLIVSQRFYQFCQTHGLKAQWSPVHVDEA